MRNHEEHADLLENRGVTALYTDVCEIIDGALRPR